MDVQRLILRTFEDALSDLGEVAYANGGRQALEILSSGRPFDIVIADANMPSIDGWELLAAIRANPSLRSMFVVLTATQATEEGVARALALGANGFLKKPFASAQVKRLVADLGIS